MFYRFLKRFVRLKNMLAGVICIFFFIQQAYSQEYELNWVRTEGGSGSDAGRRIAVDAAGNSYVTGYFSGEFLVGGFRLKSAGQMDIFIAKFSPDWVVLWAKSAGGPYNDGGNAIAVDGSGNVYVTGNFRSSAQFGSKKLITILANGDDIFFAKLNASGEFISANQQGGPFADSGNGIAIDEAGNIYFARSWGPMSIISKYDASGNEIWSKSHGVTSDDDPNILTCQDIAVNVSSQIFICGEYQAGGDGSEIVFGESRYRIANGDNMSYSDGFIHKINDLGNISWIRFLHSDFSDFYRGIVTDRSGNVYVIGEVNHYININKYNSSGNSVWSKNVGESGNTNNYGFGIAVDGSNRVFVTGQFGGAAAFGNTTLASTGPADIFIAMLDASGEFLWARKVGGAESDGGRGIALDGSGNIYVTGLFRGTALFDRSQQTSNNGSDDIFIAKYRPVTPQDIACDVSSQYMGSVNVGSFLERTFVISNTGTQKLRVSSTTITGTHSSQFSIQSGGGAFDLLTVGSTRNITVRFSPTSAGSKNASLNIASNDPDEPTLNIALSGTGVSGGGGFSIAVDGTRDVFYNTLTSPDNGYIQLRSYAWNDNGMPDNDTDLSAKVWTAWDETWLYLYEEVKDNTLSGNAANVWEEDCIELKVDPQATSEANSVWGTCLTALDMSSAGVVSADNMNNLSDSQKKWFRKSITGGYSLELAVQWAAITSGSETITPAVGNVFGAAINQHDNDGSAGRESTVQWAAVLLDAAWSTPAYLGTMKFLADHKLQFIPRNNITGVTNPVPYDGRDYNRSTTSQPDISSNPASGDYGPVNTGSNAEKTFVISNTGTADLNVTGTTLTGSNPSDFSMQSGGGAFTLAAGATRNIVVRFTPSSAGGKSASLSIASNDPDENPFNIGLSGTGGGGGTAFSIVVDGTNDAFYGALTGPDNGFLQLRYYAWNDNGKPVNDADLSAKIWTAWDDTWFYLYEEVKDNTLSGNAVNLYEEDCIEVKIDPQTASDAAEYLWETRLTALGSGSPGVVGVDNLNSVSDSQKQWARKLISGGYALELAVQWASITSGGETVTPAVGNVFGMAINQHDNDGTAGRESTVMWAAVLLDAAWNNPNYLGTVKFLADHKMQFTAKNNITSVTNPVPYDGSDYNRTGVEEVSRTPAGFRLEQNYPNPFNPSTRISFSVFKPGDARIEIYNPLGRCVRTFVMAQCSPGPHEVEWDGSDNNGQSAGSGIFIFMLSDGSRSVSKKMIKLE
jgi:hypothetical protein